jgi:thiol-disulfide isomerase/thioredoxin
MTAEPAALPPPDAPRVASGPNFVLRYAVAGLLLCAAAALFWPKGPASKEAPGGFVIDVQGRPLPLASRFAPVTVVHFWATWCPPCIEEAPALDRLTRDFASPGRLAVVRIAVADSPDRVRKFLRGNDQDLLFDPQWDVAHRYGTRQLPESYVIVGGKVVQKFEGVANWDAPELRARLTAWRDGPLPSAR